MASFNKAILIGNLVADPELKKTPSGVSVTSFRIAVGRRFDKDATDFIDIVAWRGTAEFVCQYFGKGKPILVCGAIQTRSWTDQNSNKRFAVEVVADEVSFVEKKSDNAPTSAQQNEPTYEEVNDESDLPF
jgi:single-strand DNA-binding protein